MSTFLREEEGPTWQQLLEEGKTCLSDAGVTESGLDAWYLLEASFGIDQVHFLMDRTRRVNRQRLEKSYPVYRDYLEKRASRIPIQHILGNQEFMGLEFTVDENVLIPRQDTEKLVETVLRDHKNQALSVLDMCTGSGCIAVSLAVLGGYDKVTAADISKAALKVAKKNVRRHFLVQKGTARSESTLISDTPWKLKMCTYVYQGGDAQEQETAGESVSDNGYSPGIARIPGVRKKAFVLLESDLFLNLEQDEKFDIIVSNPPYIPSAVIDGLEPEVKDHEPRMALDGAEDGLYFYRILAQQSGRYLKEGGFIYFEIGCDQAEAVGKLLTAAGFGEIETIKDEPGLDRVVRARRNR